MRPFHFSLVVAAVGGGVVMAAPPPSPEELELQREMDDLTDADYMFRDQTLGNAFRS